MKIKNNQMDLIKLKSFCTANSKGNRMKSQPTELEKIFENEMGENTWKWNDRQRINLQNVQIAHK